jgi:hypothetical protein
MQVKKFKATNSADREQIVHRKRGKVAPLVGIDEQRIGIDYNRLRHVQANSEHEVRLR